jgi:DNA-binding NtrC family response regulator
MTSPSQSDSTVLVVDDEAANLESLERIFTREGMRTFVASSGARALELCRQHRIDVVLTDLMMPGMDGLSLLKALGTVAPDAAVVVMTAYGTVESAVSAMREGAYDFVEKPLKRVQIVKTVKQAAERQALVSENRSLRQELSQLKHRSIVGSSETLRRALSVASQAAPSTANVLVLGESGTGKELLARHVHEQSGRKGAFVAVNLAALPESIVESEIFGHEKGAFTGASARREGRIAQARSGTLFLDEIGELSPHVQVKLLRVLQEGEFEPLGGRTEKADFRLVAATNRDLAKEVAQGRFREDLFYRLNVIAITCPPLRKRREDIPLLVDHFVDTYCRKNGRPALQVTREALDRLTSYDWPGNVRELENVIERAVVLCADGILKEGDLPEPIAAAVHHEPTLSFAIGTPLEEIERRVIHATLEHVQGDKRLAAQLLGIATRTIYRKLDTGRDGDEAEGPSDPDDKMA